MDLPALHTIQLILRTYLIINVMLITAPTPYYQYNRLPGLNEIIVFISPKSGGNRGSGLIKEFKQVLPYNVFSVTGETPPMKGLRMFKYLHDKRILVCGGDGTVDWVLSELAKLLPNNMIPPTAILPLGTGNDLARAFGWGASYTNEPICDILGNVFDEVTTLDRWDVWVRPTPYQGWEPSISPEMIKKYACKLPVTTFNNYFSIGMDAEIAVKFDQSRKMYPNLYKDQIVNKFWYGVHSTVNLLAKKRHYPEFNQIIQSLMCDNRHIDYPVGNYATILFLNIPSYSSGNNPWSTRGKYGPFQEQRKDDMRIEVMAFTVGQMITMNIGQPGTSLAQCHEITFRTTTTLTVQMDGEGCIIPASAIRITLNGQVPMVEKQNRGPSQKMTHVRNACESQLMSQSYWGR